VNVDGQWRPEGRGGRWRSVDEDPAAAAAADAASHAVCSQILSVPDDPPTNEPCAGHVSSLLLTFIDEKPAACVSRTQAITWRQPHVLFPSVLKPRRRTNVGIMLKLVCMCDPAGTRERLRGGETRPGGDGQWARGARGTHGAQLRVLRWRRERERVGGAAARGSGIRGDHLQVLWRYSTLIVTLIQPQSLLLPTP